MGIGLYAAVVPGWLQILGSVDRLTGKAEKWCDTSKYDASELLNARLAEDMLPFAYQVKSCWVHSVLALEGAAKGHFQPHMDPPPDSFAGLHDLIGQTKDALNALDPANVDALAGKEVVFSVGEKFRREFTGQDFLLGFSNPNFYFHASTAYAILRMKGLEIGKMDYLGAIPVKS